MRISSRVRTQPIKLNDYERFPNQVIRENSDLIEQAMIAEVELINHVQAVKIKNWQSAINEEIKANKKNKT